MEDSIEKKLAPCYQPEIIRALLQEDNEAAKNKIAKTYSKGRFAGWKPFSKKKEDAKGKFAYRIILQLLENKAFDPQAATGDVNWGGDYVGEYIELSRILALLSLAKVNINCRMELANFLKYFAIESAHYIRQEANDHQVESVFSKTWIDGAALREWHQSLADYFGSQNLLDSQIAALFAKVKITTSIMGHHPHAVGPDMTAVALALEKKGDIQQAINYYQPVMADFVTFLKDFEDSLDEKGFQLKSTDRITLESLALAVNRLKKLANYKDTENVITRVKAVLDHR